jgi:hypothetical protein
MIVAGGVGPVLRRLTRLLPARCPPRLILVGAGVMFFQMLRILDRLLAFQFLRVLLISTLRRVHDLRDRGAQASWKGVQNTSLSLVGASNTSLLNAAVHTAVSCRLRRRDVYPALPRGGSPRSRPPGRRLRRATAPVVAVTLLLAAPFHDQDRVTPTNQSAAVATDPRPESPARFGARVGRAGPSAPHQLYQYRL